MSALYNSLISAGSSLMGSTVENSTTPNSCPQLTDTTKVKPESKEDTPEAHQIALRKSIVMIQSNESLCASEKAKKIQVKLL